MQSNCFGMGQLATAEREWLLFPQEAMKLLRATASEDVTSLALLRERQERVLKEIGPVTLVWTEYLALWDFQCAPRWEGCLLGAKSFTGIFYSMVTQSTNLLKVPLQFAVEGLEQMQYFA